MTDSIIDTDVLIDAGRGLSEAVAWLEQVAQRSVPAVSTITQMELMIGCRNKTEVRAVERFVSRFQILKLNERISDIAVDLLRHYRLSHGLLIADALVAATALHLNVPLVTRNQRHYRFIAGLQLHAYPQPLDA